MRKAAWVAWGVCAVVIVMISVGIVRNVLDGKAQRDLLGFVQDTLFNLFAVVFAVVGALILSRQPRNWIGWLMIGPTIAFALQPLIDVEIANATPPPASPSVFLLIAVILSNSSWVFLIFPLFLIILLFPTGAPPTPRWRWVTWYAGGIVVFFVVVASLAKNIGPDPSTYGTDWKVVNPIGFLPQDILDAIFGVGWSAALALLTLLCVASLVVRYRRAGTAELTQIKWVLYACAVFGIVYALGVFWQGQEQGLLGEIWSMLFIVSIFGIPVAIGIAILRYGLWDIDVIIRRTFTYAIVAALLAVVYFGSVIVLQQIFATISGQRSEVITVLSTLAIAALFIPLRNRVQNGIDKRFNRKRYDAQKVLRQFSTTVRDETDLEKLSGSLVEVVNETMQPKSVSVWLKKAADKVTPLR
ncbi:MAG TPA: hypothetical protein VFD70_13515 [Anaerolineae bacterium]|nr:hypothetical protein [Anaerolineae bacterium]